MADFIPYIGNKENIDSVKPNNGNFIFTKDTGEIFIDTEDGRVQAGPGANIKIDSPNSFVNVGLHNVSSDFKGIRILGLGKDYINNTINISLAQEDMEKITNNFAGQQASIFMNNQRNYVNTFIIPNEITEVEIEVEEGKKINSLCWKIEAKSSTLPESVDTEFNNANHPRPAWLYFANKDLNEQIDGEIIKFDYLTIDFLPRLEKELKVTSGGRTWILPIGIKSEMLELIDGAIAEDIQQQINLNLSTTIVENKDLIIETIGNNDINKFNSLVSNKINLLKPETLSVTRGWFQQNLYPLLQDGIATGITQEYDGSKCVAMGGSDEEGHDATESGPIYLTYTLETEQKVNEFFLAGSGTNGLGTEGFSLYLNEEIEPIYTQTNNLTYGIFINFPTQNVNKIKIELKSRKTPGANSYQCWISEIGLYYNKIKTIAFVGDSITQGVHFTSEDEDDWSNKNYENNYANLLGKHFNDTYGIYEYYNMGISGAAMVDSTNYGNYGTSLHDSWLNQGTAIKADILFIMLGTNDAAFLASSSNFDQTKYLDYADTYKQNQDALIQKFKDLNPNIKIIFISPPANKQLFANKSTETEINWLLEQTKLDNYEYIDIFTPTTEYVNTSEENKNNFFDRIDIEKGLYTHPSEAGHKLIYELICEQLEDFNLPVSYGLNSTDGKPGALSQTTGYRNTNTGLRSLVYGGKNVVGSDSSFAGGYQNQILGYMSTGIGRGNYVAGAYDFAFGHNNQLFGTQDMDNEYVVQNRFAIGSGNTAAADKSSVWLIGSGLKAKDDNEIQIGHGNTPAITIDGNNNIYLNDDRDQSLQSLLSGIKKNENDIDRIWLNNNILVDDIITLQQTVGILPGAETENHETRIQKLETQAEWELNTSIGAVKRAITPEEKNNVMIFSSRPFDKEGNDVNAEWLSKTYGDTWELFDKEFKTQTIRPQWAEDVYLLEYKISDDGKIANAVHKTETFGSNGEVTSTSYTGNIYYYKARYENGTEAPKDNVYLYETIGAQFFMSGHELIGRIVLRSNKSNSYDLDTWPAVNADSTNQIIYELKNHLNSKIPQGRLQIAVGSANESGNGLCTFDINYHNTKAFESREPDKYTNTINYYETSDGGKNSPLNIQNGLAVQLNDLIGSADKKISANSYVRLNFTIPFELNEMADEDCDKFYYKRKSIKTETTT